MNQHTRLNNIQHWLTAPDKREQIYFVILQLFILFYIPQVGRIGNMVIGLLILFWFTEPDLVKKIKTALHNRTVIALILYYLAFVAGMVHTQNMHTGFLQLERKITLLIFPIIFVTITLRAETIVRILKTCIVVTALGGFAGLINSIRIVLETHDTAYLYSDNLLLLMYKGKGIGYAVTVTIALVFTCWLWFYNHFSNREKIIYVYVLAPFLIVLEFLLAGRLSLGVLFALIICGLTVLIVHQKKYKLGAILFALLVVSGIAMAVFFPKTINRFKSLTYFHFDFQDEREVYHFGETEFDGRWSGLTIRLAIWTCVFEAIAEHPVIGVGTGDYNDALTDVYQKRNFKQGLINKFTPHNQYLHAWLSGGIITLLIFLFSLAYPARQAWKDKNYLYLIFLFVILANMLIMDFLNQYRGAVFFAFFNSLLLFQPTRYPRSTAELQS